MRLGDVLHSIWQNSHTGPNIGGGMSYLCSDGTIISMNELRSIWEWLNQDVPLDTTLKEAYSGERVTPLSEEVEPLKPPAVLPDEKPAKKAQLKPKTEKSETKKIDDGKIRALRNAGWTLKKIAEEMGCSEATVHGHLKAMEEDNASNE